MDWYLVHCKPRQGYACYLPLLPCEKRARNEIVLNAEPLFPRYLFIHLDQGAEAKSWGPIRSTRGVSRLVSFGTQPARVDARLIDLLREREQALQQAPVRLLQPGDGVGFINGAFAGLEAVYVNPDGESRALVLIELLSRRQTVRVDAHHLYKVAG